MSGSGVCPRRGEPRAGERRTTPSSAALAFALTCTFIATLSYAAEDPTRRDEYGIKPGDGSDKDLALPDKVLDRGWPGLIERFATEAERNIR
mgnify:CR=1 FL=1